MKPTRYVGRIHQKGRGVQCAYKQIVPNVPSLLDSHGSKRAASPDASLNTPPQRKRANEALDLHVEEINVMDIHEENGPGYQLVNDEEDDKIDSGLSYYRTFQEALYNEVFTADCLKCTNLDDFKNLLKANGISRSRERDDGAMSLFTALKSVPRAVRDQILSISPAWLYEHSKEVGNFKKTTAQKSGNIIQTQGVRLRMARELEDY